VEQQLLWYELIQLSLPCVHYPKRISRAWLAVLCTSRQRNTAVSSKCPVVGRSRTSTISSGSGTGVIATWTISGASDGKATLRPSPSGEVVDWVSRAAMREHVVVLTGCLLSIPAVYPFTNDNVQEFVYRSNRTSTCVQSTSTSKWQLKRFQRGETRFSSATKIPAPGVFAVVLKRLTSLV